MERKTTEWWEAVQEMGFKFNPSKFELILVFLYPKVRGWSGPGDLIRRSDQVYTKPPWELCTDLTAFPGNGKYYFFTELKKNKNQKRAARTVGSYGTWQGKSKPKEISAPNNVIIGVHRKFYFRAKCEGKEIKTDWSMHEFSLPGNDLVLCVIQKKEEEMERVPLSFLDLYHTTSAGGDLCPAPAHDDHSQLQALDSEEPETWPSHSDDQSVCLNDILIFPSVPGYPNYGFL